MGELWEECLKCGVKCCSLDIAHPLFVTEEEMRRINALYPEKAKSFNKALPCPLLMDNGLCMAHAHKPVDCRLFPFDIIKVDEKYFWIVRIIDCMLLEDESKFDEYLGDMEEKLIPGFVSHLDAYSSFRSDELFSKYSHKILREVHIGKELSSVSRFNSDVVIEIGATGDT